jgi:hypothetical protein
LAKASGIDEGLLQEIRENIAWPIDKAKVNEAKHLVPDDVVRKLTAVGTPKECFEACMPYLKSGATMPVVYPVCDAAFSIEALAENMEPTSIREAGSSRLPLLRGNGGDALRRREALPSLMPGRSDEETKAQRVPQQVGKE